MRDKLGAFKPAAPASVHLLLAALMWSVVGLLLGFFGGEWVIQSGSRLTIVVLAAAIVAGLLKSRLALDRAARQIIGRIRARGDGKCLGGFVSVKTWLLIVVMVGGGRLLRWSGLLPLVVIGFIYLAVGVALLFASRHHWRAWLRERAA